ncbi:hypothetical protein EAI_08662 [Harpegnathos saltator]|uniref:Uncharacterized protein n=1 Tax=Harpegnathos saltator TaxID=610380 RepID=E2BLY6_HARSA|nr:hypothetical protein EAI_08662 [Harpegnathos saltator]
MAIKNIDTNLLSRGQLTIYITKLESPTLMWVQLKHNLADIMDLQAEIAWKCTDTQIGTPCGQGMY